ncbi:MAG: glycosyl transferase group 1 [Blastococcus sp.]|nr:glycosyl transferase group 1 [Blastococcus sp.]
MTTVHVVLPDGIDDDARPSGGNGYDRRLCDELTASGWNVRELVVPGPWPRPGRTTLSRLARAVATVPDGGLVLLDGLIASAGAAALVPESARLRLVVLVHMPFGEVAVAAAAECAVLTHARAVVATSEWTRRQLLDRYRLPPGRVHVARPGADRGDEAPGTPGGGRLLCVAAVVPHKGHDLLLSALSGIASPSWSCTVVGPLDRDPPFVARLRLLSADRLLADRILFTGPLAGPELRRQYRRADLLVLPSRLEAYGMVVTEALAVGLPVVAADVGGVPEALGRTPEGLPGVLVPPDDADALRVALCTWLTDAGQRARLRRAARERRRALEGWEATAARVAEVLVAVGAEPRPVARADPVCGT